jgi:hypothetical protein
MTEDKYGLSHSEAYYPEICLPKLPLTVAN